MLRGGVFHQWSLRIPMNTQSLRQPRRASFNTPAAIALHLRTSDLMKVTSQRRLGLLALAFLAAGASATGMGNARADDGHNAPALGVKAPVACR